eukprot:321034_1
MVKIRLRPARAPSPSLSHSSNSSSNKEQEHQPLRIISNNITSMMNVSACTPPRSTTKMSRKSATRMVMDIIESPRRVLANRKKRMSTNSSANANTASISSQSSPGT